MDWFAPHLSLDSGVAFRATCPNKQSHEFGQQASVSCVAHRLNFN